LTGSSRRTVPGSSSTPVPGDQLVGQLGPGTHIDLTVYLRAPPDTTSLESQVAAQASLPPADRTYLTQEQYAELNGALPSDIEKVVQFARQYGLQVTGVNRAARTIDLSGSAHAMSQAFGVHLHVFRDRTGRTYRGRTGALSVPQELDGIIEAVHGFTNRPFAGPSADE
jgi:kumamolisin